LRRRKFLSAFKECAAAIVEQLRKKSSRGSTHPDPEADGFTDQLQQSHPKLAPAFLHAFKFRSNRNSDAPLQAVEPLQNLNQDRRRACPPMRL
jgi:hypothetical protein